MSFRKEIIIGVSWLGVFRVITRIVSFLRIIFLARLLSPTQFGIYGVASLVLIFLDIITDTGIQMLLVQEKEASKNHINSAWVVSIFRGLLIGIVIFLCAPVIAYFFNSPDALPLIRLISIVPIIKGFANPGVFEFQKNLQFNKEFSFRTTVFIIDALAAVYFTWITNNPAGIILGLIVGAITETSLSFILTKTRPQFIYNGSIIKAFLHRGKWITGSSIFTYLITNGDTIAIGKVLDTRFLGVYQMAYNLSILPISEITDVFSKVTFPIYAQVSHDIHRLRLLFFKVVAVTAVITFPISAVLFLFPNELINLLLGQQWIIAGSVLPILAVSGFIRSIVNTTFPLFLATQKQQYITVIQAVGGLVLMVTIVPSVFYFGIIGAGYSVIASTIISVPVIIFYTVRLLNADNET